MVQEEYRAESEKESQAGQEELWENLCDRIEAAEVIPIISNAVYFDRIFDIDEDQIIGVSSEKKNPENWSIEEQLARKWAKDIDYPLSESHWLPRVALYDRVVNCSNDRAAKKSYLNWLKEELLTLAEEDENVEPEKIEELRDDFEKQNFSFIAGELGYPKSVQDRADTLERLAKLHLPLYITTSYFDFLERAIKNDRRKPRTQICFWKKKPARYSDESHKQDLDFELRDEEPLVYHFCGLEDYPESMVLTEDDYLNFLAEIFEDNDQHKQTVTWRLREYLTNYSLLLLGYRLRDWDFKALFRGLLKSQADNRQFNLAIQLDPKNQQGITSSEEVTAYLQEYFGSENFEIFWGTPDKFLETLWEKWEQWRH